MEETLPSHKLQERSVKYNIPGGQVVGLSQQENFNA